ncbi:tRNA (adenosine(37)-N6)-threonylcarbamoyltransferase complex ATPase subunit type 1 TsaE [Millisia brevis]|uniref:tRNA (adenosine(37)-N6)-threonylcarbamoyltransferase complex ATPase subunit type 1 TsaE n=1 Tax=Millisia brevis TaxID=264148 RepID=UPI0008359F57|nr:tRNA (adenosine(37)-N6)-threonylcarbamoyltransferase complex ATPase subunit type 1 TsaE [Millisia brevis]
MTGDGTEPGTRAADHPERLETTADTEEYGRRLAATLRTGDVVVLDGPVGAGKTAMTRGIADGLGVQGRVSSPTFVIARTHRPGERPDGRPSIGLVHVDAYRLGTAGGDVFDELAALDLESELDSSVLVIEWGARLVTGVTDRYLLVRLRRDIESETRFVSREWVLTGPSGVGGSADAGVDGR